MSNFLDKQNYKYAKKYGVRRLYFGEKTKKGDVGYVQPGAKKFKPAIGISYDPNNMHPIYRKIIKEELEDMKAKILNPETAAQRKARMARVRSFKKSKKRPASKTVTKRKSRKRFVRSMKKISKPVVRKKNPESDRSMRAAHLRVSTLIVELGKRKKVTVDFDQSDKFWLMYILKKI